MRLLDLNLVTEAVKNMLIDACENIPVNVIERLKEAKERSKPLGKAFSTKSSKTICLRLDAMCRFARIPEWLSAFGNRFAGGF